MNRRSFIADTSLALAFSMVASTAQAVTSCLPTTSRESPLPREHYMFSSPRAC
jgi:hypothetical protein